MAGRKSQRPQPLRRETLIVSLVLIKILVLCLLWTGFDLSGPVHAQDDEAQEVQNPVATPELQEGNGEFGNVAFSEVDYPDDLLPFIEKEREALKAREEAVRQREEQVRDHEARLHKIEGEIEARLDNLTQMRAALQALIQEKQVLDDQILEQRENLENEILKKLAKVYESTPPEQAGPMLSKLDVELAAEILIRMDGRKAGKIWGFVSPEKASRISSEISRME